MKYIVTMIVILGIAHAAIAAEEKPYELRGVGVEEHLGAQVSFNLPFVNESGAAVTLGQYVTGDRPVILTMVYYECPSLCSLFLNGFTDSLRQLSWSVGTEFDVVTVSIDPREGPELAASKKNAYLASYDRDAGAGWHFLTGTEEHVRQLASEVGFGYRYDADEQQYAHAAVAMFLTPKGVVSRYLHGIQFAQRDVKLALLEASQGNIGSIVDHLLMYCYRYDPKGKKYAVFATNVMKGAASVTLLGLVLGICSLARTRRKVLG